MRTYVRTRIPGGAYFFTVNLAERRNNSLLTDHITHLREAFRAVRIAHPLVIETRKVCSS